MDTRSKILAPGSEWPRLARPLIIVTGHFEVLVAEHVRELQHARQSTSAAALLAVVLPGAAGLLPLQARLELLAALRIVDYATASDWSRLDVLIASLQPANVVRLEEGDVQRFRRLRERIVGAHGR